MILRLPILISLLMTISIARCDNLHAESRDVAIAAYEANRTAMQLSTVDCHSEAGRAGLRNLVAVCEMPRIDQARQ